MNKLSVNGKNWLLKKYNQEEVSYIKDGEFVLFKDYSELNQKMKKDLS